MLLHYFFEAGRVIKMAFYIAKYTAGTEGI